MKSLAGSWVGLVFLSNFLFMLIIAGGLHLFLFTYRLQGKQLKYDHRESHEISRKFTFHHQVRDNMFWSLVSGSAIWSIYETLYFHGVARGAIPTVTLAEHPFAFVLWLLAMPIITSSHFYAIHRLLHWPPLYRTVHRLHHRNIHIGPWSGMAMHPVEHIFYISSVLIHFIIPSHPVILLMHLYGRCLGPAFSHLGFRKADHRQQPLTRFRRLPSPTAPPLLRVQLRHCRNAVGSMVRNRSRWLTGSHRTRASKSACSGHSRTLLNSLSQQGGKGTRSGDA
jgi:sterol desaturase/sphingolipid hydroxylase (fatty acid hydroxylase superfamily)